MRRVFSPMLIAIVILLSLGVSGATSATTPQFTVDLSNLYRPVTHVASGSLYGLANDGAPPDSLIQPTKPKVFTQMAPNGQQLPNGETAPVGDALKVAAAAARAGAQVTIRMPDIYPNFPYKWVSWTDWYSKVDTMVSQYNASGVTNVYAWELWNEPDWTWDTTNAGPFLDGWANTFRRLRADLPSARILGPSYSTYNHQWMSDFLTYAKTNGVLPNVICWHELNGNSGYQTQADISDYRALETSLGIAPIPISIDEYGTTAEEGVPGSMVRYLAEFERGGADSATMAFWFRPGRLSNLITNDVTANGGWWLYKWYGDMSGQMAQTTPQSTTSLGLDGIANVDATAQSASVVFGGASGDNTIVVKGFTAQSFFGTTVHVKIEATPWYGVDTAVSGPIQVGEGDFGVTNNQISVPVSDMNASWGYHLIITPSGTTKTRYEAEKATVTHANLFSNANASNGQYVGQIDLSDSAVTFTVNAASSGTYDVEVRYANGGTATSTQTLSVNGGAATSVSYPATGGWMSSGYNGVVHVRVNLNAGSNTLKFGNSGNGYAELDELQVQPVSDFPMRLEAENATVNHAVVDTSSYASSQWFVGQINYSDSYVQFNPTVPTAGTYYMDIGFANGTSANSTHLLSVNGAAASTVTYAPTGGWTKDVPNMGTRRIKTIAVALNAGSNTIRFTYSGVGYAELDYIELRTGVTRYEAENALVTHATNYANAATSNGHYIGGIDYSDSSVKFTVSAPSAGTYTVRIAYANGTSAPSTHNLSVNGGPATTVTYPTTGNWLASEASGLKTITVSLNQGSNTLTFSHGTTGYAELDYIDVSS